MTPFYSLSINDILAYFNVSVSGGLNTEEARNSKKGFMTRGIMIGAILASAGLALLVLLVPAIRTAFSFTAIDGKHWLVVDIFKLFKINGTRNDS
jgi:hypothetical protein